MGYPLGTLQMLALRKALFFCFQNMEAPQLTSPGISPPTLQPGTSKVRKAWMDIMAIRTAVCTYVS